MHGSTLNNSMSDVFTQIFVAHHDLVNTGVNHITNWLARVSRHSSPNHPGLLCLLQGEDGTGKTTLLRQIHNCTQAFAPSSCLTSTLISCADIDAQLNHSHTQHMPLTYLRSLHQAISQSLQHTGQQLPLSNYLAHVDTTQARLDKLYGYNHKLRLIKSPSIQHIYTEKTIPEKEPKYDQMALLFGEHLQTLATTQPLLLFFDDYDHIFEHDALFQLVISSAGPNVAWVLTSNDHIESTKFVLSYQPLIQTTPYIITLTEHNIAFTLQDILDYFTQLCSHYPHLPTLTTAQAQDILHLTRGFPYAVRLFAEIYMYNTNIQPITNQHAQTYQQAVLYTLTTLFEHSPDVCLNSNLYKLTMLRTINTPQAFNYMLGASDLSPTEQEGLIQAMSQNYKFIKMVKNQPILQKTARRYLRAWLLDQSHVAQISTIIQEITTMQHAVLTELEQSHTYSDLKSRFDDQQWLQGYLDWIEALFWSNQQQAICNAIAFLLAANLFCPPKVSELFDVVRFFEPKLSQTHRNWWLQACLGLYGDTTHPTENLATKLQALKQTETLFNTHLSSLPPFLAPHRTCFLAAIWLKCGWLYKDVAPQDSLSFYHQAFPQLFTGSQLHKQFARLYWRFAVTCSDNQKYTLSISYLTEAIKYDLEFADAHFNLGNAYFATKQYTKAITAYQYAIEFEQHSIQSWKNLGNAHLALHDYQRALAEYQKALDFGVDIQILYNRAFIFNTLHDYQQALAELKSITSLSDHTDTHTIAAAHMLCGNIHASLGHKTAAEQAYRDSADSNPATALHPKWLLQWLRFKTQPASIRTARALKELAVHDTSNYIADVCQAVADIIYGRPLPNIINQLNQLAAKEPDQWDIYFWRAFAFVKHNNISAALADLHKAQALNIPCLFLRPLYWLQVDYPDFFTQHAEPLLKQNNL